MQESKYTPPRNTNVRHSLTKKEFISILNGEKETLFLIGYKYLKNEADAKDAYQETVLSLWKNKNTIHTNLAAAAKKKMQFTCLDFLEKRKSKRNLLNGAKTLASKASKALQVQPETKSINWADYLRDLSQQYNLDHTLSPQEKLAIIYKSEGYSAPEIADFMIEDGFVNINAYRVNKSIERAREKLRKLDLFASKRKKK